MSFYNRLPAVEKCLDKSLLLRKVICMQSLIFSKYLSGTPFFTCQNFKNHHSSHNHGTICFQGQLWGGFTSTNFCLVLSHQKHSSRGFLLAKYGTSIRSFSINSCSEYFWEIPRKTSAHMQYIFELSICTVV